MTEQELYNEYRKSDCKSFTDFLVNKITELKEQCSILADCNSCTFSCKTENLEMKKQLSKAKELLNEFLDFEASCMERGIYISDKTRAEAEQFIK